MTIWRTIPSLPGYLASSDGHVMRIPYLAPMPHDRGWRVYGGEPTKGVTHPKNFNRPTIRFSGRNYRVSILICEAFHGPKPFPKAVAMHIDDDQTNNRRENLKWGTQKENLNTPKFIAYCKSRTGENSSGAKGRAAKIIAINDPTGEKAGELLARILEARANGLY